MFKIQLKDQEVLNSYHDPDRDIVALDLYPSVPEDLRDWAQRIGLKGPALKNFLDNMNEEYTVQVMVDRNTGDFKIADVHFYPRKS